MTYWPLSLYIKAISLFTLDILPYIFMPIWKAMATIWPIYNRSQLYCHSILWQHLRLMIRLDPFVLDTRHTEDIVRRLRNKTSRLWLKLNITTFAPVLFFLTLLLSVVSFHYLSKGKKRKKNKRKKSESSSFLFNGVFQSHYLNME